MTNELDRAQEYRRMMQAREDTKADRERALSGDDSRKAALEAAMDPLRPWDGWDPDRKTEGDEQ